MKKIEGLHVHRYKNNPEERRFALAWAETSHLKYLLSTHYNNRPIDPSGRDQVVAATVIQWLGSPVGQDFLESLGYTKKTSRRRDPNDE